MSRPHNSCVRATINPGLSQDSKRSADVAAGTVKWFNLAKGWGLFNPTAEKDVFVHISAVEKAALPVRHRKICGFNADFTVGVMSGWSWTSI